MSIASNINYLDEFYHRDHEDELAREGARRMLMSALEEEVAPYLQERHAEMRDAESRLLVVRKGQGGAGPVHEPHPAAVFAPFAEGGRGPAGFVLAGAFDGDLAWSSRRCSGRGGSRGGLRLTAVWEEKYRQFCKRSLEGGDNV